MLWTTAIGRFGGGSSPWAELDHMENEMNRILSRYAYPSSGEAEKPKKVRVKSA